MIRLLALCAQRFVRAPDSIFAADLECFMEDIQFGESFFETRTYLRWRTLSRLIKQVFPQGVIDRAPIIRVHKAEVPQFRALIDVRNARCSQLDQRLSERIQPPRRSKSLSEF